MKPDRLVLEIKLRDGYGRVHAVIAEEVPEDVAYRGPRIADELHLGLISPAAGMTPMEAAVEVLQVRELRRKKFREIMPRLAERLADFLHDREGWSDPDRQAKTERLARDAE